MGLEIRPPARHAAAPALHAIYGRAPTYKPLGDVPPEINDHLRLYGKEPWEVSYGEECPLCGDPVDEFNLCSCGSGGT